MSVDTGVLVVRRSRAEIERLVALFGSSGMGRLEFCRSQGVALSTLGRHLRKQGSRHSDPLSKGIKRSRLVAVELSAALPVVRTADLSPTLVVLLPNKRRVEVGRGFDQDTLAQLLTVLEKCRPCSE